MGIVCSTNGENRNAYKTLVRKPVEKKPLGKPRHRWMDDIRKNFRGIDWDGTDSIDVAQYRDQWKVLMNMVMKLRVP
jgi:hypothetical protein